LEVSLTQMAFIASKVSNLLKVGANEVFEAETDKTIGSDQGAIEAMQRRLYDLGESVQWAIKGVVRIPEQYRSAPAEAAGRQENASLTVLHVPFACFFISLLFFSWVFQVSVRRIQ
jgi:phage shock protein A